MRRAVLIAVLLLTGCDAENSAGVDPSAGALLENAAIAAGLVPDPLRASITGAWARDTDRVCIVPDGKDTLRIGAIVDYGEGAGCAGSGTARRSGAGIAVAFGACRMDATFDGERIVFPAEVSPACESLCAGRASFAALSVTQVSDSVSEASALRSAKNRPVCGG